MELINGRTAEEIKARLACCSKERGCYVCPDVADSDCSLKLCADALALIERLEAAQPRWISVEERLPDKLNENNQVYLTEQVIGFDGECAYVGQFKVYKFDEYWTFFDGGFLRDDITHWMPLPEPPKEGSE